MAFPKILSFTITNACNLRCRMCAQWSEDGYVTTGVKPAKPSMQTDDWKRLVDEATPHGIDLIIVRGGEPFLHSGIIDLLEHIRSKDIFIAVDTNGTVLEKYVDDLVRIGNMHITFSVDGPKDVHDKVRQSEGSFLKIKENVRRLLDAEQRHDTTLSKGICCTVSRYNYQSIGDMPDVARELGIDTVNLVPYYYVPAATGARYEQQLRDNFGSNAFSWRGFHHEDSGVDLEIFEAAFAKYLHELRDIRNDTFLPFKSRDYLTWFKDSEIPVGAENCWNIERLMDIQPDGAANFCIDFPDYSPGNVMQSSIAELWNSKRAAKFRDYRRAQPFAVCGRCGAKYCSMPR
ncbi:MAG: radical SAM protein [Deltaproteobacteria bacterium]|nr:radical SAM protein [Deltaproteobacteria bacterium]